MYGIVTKLLFLREALKPYVLDQMRLAAERGTLAMRPLCSTTRATRSPGPWTTSSPSGPTIVVAPIEELGARARCVYLPRRASWRHAVTGENYAGGEWHDVDAPLDHIPVFVRAGADPSVGFARAFCFRMTYDHPIHGSPIRISPCGRTPLSPNWWQASR